MRMKFMICCCIVIVIFLALHRALQHTTRCRAGSHVTQWKESWAKEVFFGMNVLHERRGVLRVGDEVEVLRVAKKAIPKVGIKTD